jgi:nucleoside-diphosphate-sugar epimerase
MSDTKRSRTRRGAAAGEAELAPGRSVASSSNGRRPAVVTGAGGWLGQNLVRALAPERSRVRCLVHRAEEAPLLEVVGPTVEVVVGDVRDPVAADQLFDGVGESTVFHAAAVIHPERQTRELFDVNAGGTELVLDRARRAGAARFVHVSSNSPFGTNPTPEHVFTEDSPFDPYLAYGQSKLEAEDLVRRAHERGEVPTVIVRAPWFYGPFQPARQTQFFAAIRRGRFPLVGDGAQRRSMVYTGNLVDGLLRAEATDAAAGRAYWIADAEPHELRAILAGVRTALEAEGLEVSPRQPRLPALAARFAEGVDRVVQSRGLYVQPVHVLGELGHTIACDISRARAELGYEPATALVEGMRSSIRWCLERGEAL